MKMRSYLQVFRDQLFLIIPDQKGRKSCYTLTPTKCDWGAKAFRLNKVQPAPKEDDREYYVLIDEDQSSCDCTGFISRNHCKHLSSLEDLIKEGKLS